MGDRSTFRVWPTLLLLVSVATATSIDDLEFGSTLWGEEYKPEDLKGRVVLVDYWRGHKAEGAEAIPRLVKLQEEHKDKLVIIGVYADRVTGTLFLNLARDARVNYTIVDTLLLNGEAMPIRPVYLLFDHTGALVYEGREDSIGVPVNTAVKTAPDWLVGDHPYSKLVALTTQVKARKGLGKVLAECRRLAEGADGVAAQEAEWLMERLAFHGRRLLERAKAAEEKDPDRAMSLYDQAAKTFAGDTIAETAAAETKRLNEDPAFRRELEAAKKLKALDPGVEKVKSCKRNQPLDPVYCEDCRKKNAALIEQLAPKLLAIWEEYEGTAAAARAWELLHFWGKR